MTLNSEQKEAAVSILTSMLSLLGLSAKVTIEEHKEQTIVTLQSEEPGRLIGRRGRVIENLEYLLNRALSQRFEGAVNVGINVDGYQGKEGEQEDKGQRSAGEVDEEIDSSWEEQFRKMALDAAKEVRRWGGQKELGPFSPRERRVVHLALVDDPEVETESEEGVEKGRKKVFIRAVDEKN